MAGKYESSPNRRRRKRPTTTRRFFRRYLPSILLIGLLILCAAVIVFTVLTISGKLQKPDPTQPQNQATESIPESTEALRLAQAEELIKKADQMVLGYDYPGAIALLQSFEGFEYYPMMTEKILEYTRENEKLVSYSEMNNITHLFFHPLIVDTDRAFDGDPEQNSYNLYYVTVSEFKAILQSLYDRGYVLVSPYDVAYEKIDASGNPVFTYGNIRLPEGKTPFLLSQDDVNYYGSMIGNASGVNETPVFAKASGDGFASRIVIGADGYPTCEYTDASGVVSVGDYDIVPILEKFIQEHPDFSYHGARAILGVTGYEGVFGYRTKPSYEAALGTEAYNKEVADAKAVAQCLKEHGWILASHTYGHASYGSTTLEKLQSDTDKWEETVQPIIGDTDILLYPHGSDISGVSKYTFDNEKFAALYADGYRYFFNTDSRVAWAQLGTNYFRGSRRNIDGYRMYHNPDKLSDLFDVDAVFDEARPTPVPTL